MKILKYMFHFKQNIKNRLTLDYILFDEFRNVFLVYKWSTWTVFFYLLETTNSLFLHFWYSYACKVNIILVKCFPDKFLLENNRNLSKKIVDKMKVLNLNRKYLVLLGVCTTSNAFHQAVFKAAYFLVLVLQILGLLSGVWFIATYLKSDLNGVLYSGFHTSAYSTSAYSLVVGYVHQDKIVAIFQTLQCIYDECGGNNTFLPLITTFESRRSFK